MKTGIFSRWKAGRCALCQRCTRSQLDICQYCIARLPLSLSTCVTCALPLPVALKANLRQCGRCLRHPPPVDATVSVCRYAYPADALVLGLKFRAELKYGRIIGELLASTLQQRCTATGGPSSTDLLVPVPLSRWRFATRGYNQSQEIARTLSRVLSIPCRPDVLRRCRHSQPQAGLRGDSRQQNVRGAFFSSNVAGQRVAIVDDVMTTGSTAFAAARALRQAGARSVVVWVFARAV